MSVSLVVLRFEVAEDSKVLKSIRFSTRKQDSADMTEKVDKKMPEDDQRQDFPDVLASSTSAPSPKLQTTPKENMSEETNPTSPSETSTSASSITKDTVAIQEQLEQHRGSREMRELTVETMIFTASNNKKKNHADTGKTKPTKQQHEGTTPIDPESLRTSSTPQNSDQAKLSKVKEPPNSSESRSNKPSGNKSKKSKKMPGNPAANKKGPKPESAAPNVSNGTRPPMDSSKVKQTVNKENSHEEQPKPEAPSLDPAFATKSHASAVTRDPPVPMVELETTDCPDPIDDVSVGGGMPDNKHIPKSPLSKHQDTIPFCSGNPSVEITKGILHLFKENEMTPLDEGVTRSEMLCMLAVPAMMTCHDLLLLAAPLTQGIQLMRIIRDSTPNQYMVLIKFKQQKDADEFYTEFNGKPFNSIESSVCYLVYVSRVECMKASEGAALPVPGLTELPTCHICLERMDESVDGILTVLCNHSFHGNCLNKWGDTSCPVCRYCQTPEPVEDHKCFTCEAQESLWICLICGHVGCGRYSNRHSYRHFEETQHTYAMQLGNQRVWDYAGDNYVHRLVQSKGDGKPIEWDRQDTETAHTEKLDSLQLEYSYLLTSQLESQRIYFEEQMTRIEQDALNRMSEVEARSRKTVEERDKMEQCLQAALKEKASLDRKCGQLNSRLGKVTVECKEEKEMNLSLLENQQAWRTRVTELETKYAVHSKKKQEETNELKEQLRDLMFNLDAQHQIGSTSKDTQQEIQDGKIVIGEAAAAGPSASSTSSRKGKKKGR